MIIFSAAGAIAFLLSVALVFLLLGLIGAELFSGSYRRAVDDHTREQFLELAERRRPGRIT